MKDSILAAGLTASNVKWRDVIVTAQEWIPCSERLPEREDWYLVTVIREDKLLCERYTTMSDFRNGKFNYFWRGEVTAWCPLPEPYGGE